MQNSIEYIDGFLTSNRSFYVYELAKHIDAISIIISVLNGTLKNRFGIKYVLFAECVRCCLLSLDLIDISQLDNNQIQVLIKTLIPYTTNILYSIKEPAVSILSKLNDKNQHIRP